MKTIPQITSAEPRIRMPAWRRASPKKWNTRPLKTSPNVRAAEADDVAETGDPVPGYVEPATRPTHGGA